MPVLVVVFCGGVFGVWFVGFCFCGEGCVRMGGGVWLWVGFSFEREVGERVSRREKI